MPTLDPKRLMELLRIAQHGSYTRAAAALGVSQPALSNSMAVLEKAAGVPLLRRTRHGATLTDAGRLLVRHAIALDTVLARAAGDLEIKKRGLEGSLAVGVSPIGAVDIVPDALIRIKRETPAIAVAIHERPDDELLEALRSGEIDVMISPAGSTSDPPDIERDVLLRDAFVVVLRRTHKLARKTSLTLADLRGQEWVMPNAHTTMCRQIEALFAAENEPWPDHYVATNSISALRALLMRSDMVSISSRRLVALEVRARQLAAVALRKPHFAREICLRRRRNADLTPLAQRFVATLRRLAADVSKGR